MQRKPHFMFLTAIVLASIIAGVGCDKLRARDKLNKGVQAYKNAQFDVAIEDFKEAKQYDPTLTNAELYLATAYASQYIPGAPSPDNIRYGDQAVSEFKSILDTDPNNISALDGIGSILYGMGSSPYDEAKLNQSKDYHQKHIQLQPSDPEPYYWIGVIDWKLCYETNEDMRNTYNKTSKKPIKENDPMPPAVAAQFTQKCGSIVDEGMTNLQKAIDLRPDYDDAMAYMNLLYRQKADTETSADAREADLKQADSLVDRVKEIKQKKANITPATS